MTRNPIGFNDSYHEVWKVMKQGMEQIIVSIISNITKFGSMGGELLLTSNPGCYSSAFPRNVILSI